MNHTPNALHLPRRTASDTLRRVVYTCLFGHSEPFNDFAYEYDEQITYVCFTDDPELRSDHWEMRLVARELLDAPRASKRIKALAHRFLREYTWSLYVDNTVRLKQHPRTLFDRYLASSKSPLVCFRHPERNCVYDEAEAVLRYELDEPSRVLAQMASYRQLGYPAQAGLAKATILLRRHNDPSLIPVMERWHQQVLRHSLRDQLSLNPAAWYDGFAIGYLEQDFFEYELLQWPVVKDDQRLPRDFDDVRYHALNPDVEIDGRKHYMLVGAAEGRLYK